MALNLHSSPKSTMDYYGNSTVEASQLPELLTVTLNLTTSPARIVLLPAVIAE